MPILLCTLFATQGACDKNCEKLRARVCDDPQYLKDNKRHCEMMEQVERFESLSGDTCKGILDHLSER